MTHPNSATGSDHVGVNLRLVWPQWQGAGTSSARELASEFPFDAARRGYAVGSAVLEAVLPPHDGPALQCRSRCQAPASRSAAVSKPRR